MHIGPKENVLEMMLKKRKPFIINEKLLELGKEPGHNITGF